MYLIDWFQANLLMAATTIALIGIPAVILFVVFGKKKEGGSGTGSSGEAG